MEETEFFLFFFSKTAINFQGWVVLRRRGGGGGGGGGGRGLTVCSQNLISLFFNQNLCCGYSKEPSQ